MKTQKKKTIRITVMIFTFLALLTTVSCNNKKDKTKTENPTSIIPNEDLHTATFLGNIESLEQHVKARSDLNKKNEAESI